MATAIGPEFSLGNVIYPVPAGFDWSQDQDVLADAVRETHAAIRWHQLAAQGMMALDCVCADPLAHRDLLLSGYTALLAVLRPEQGLPTSMWERMPVARQFLTYVSSFLAAVFVLELGPLV